MARVKFRRGTKVKVKADGDLAKLGNNSDKTECFGRVEGNIRVMHGIIVMIRLDKSDRQVGIAQSYVRRS